MLGTVGFEGLSFQCILGEEPSERVNERQIVVDLSVETKFDKVAITDALEDTVDYVKLSDICREVAILGKYHMLEKYAATVTERILQDFPVASVSIRVRKPGAFAGATCSVVEFKRKR